MFGAFGSEGMPGQLTHGRAVVSGTTVFFSPSLAAARPVEGVVVKESDHKPVINPVQDITPDGRPMEETTYPEHLAPGVSLDSGLKAGCQIWNHCHYRFIKRRWSHNLK